MIWVPNGLVLEHLGLRRQEFPSLGIVSLYFVFKISMLNVKDIISLYLMSLTFQSKLRICFSIINHNTDTERWVNVGEVGSAGVGVGGRIEQSPASAYTPGVSVCGQQQPPDLPQNRFAGLLF